MRNTRLSQRKTPISFELSEQLPTPSIYSLWPALVQLILTPALLSCWTCRHSPLFPLLPSTTMAVSLSTGARIRLKEGSCVCALPRARLTESSIKMNLKVRWRLFLLHEYFFRRMHFFLVRKSSKQQLLACFLMRSPSSVLDSYLKLSRTQGGFKVLYRGRSSN